MKLQDGIVEIIQQAAAAVARDGAEIPQSVYVRATDVFGDAGDVRELSKGIGVDCADFLRVSCVALGMLRGLHQRLNAVMHKESGEILPQSAAFVLVDLHGRGLGIEAMVHQIADMIEGARTQRISESSLRARMVTVFLMLEEGLTTVAGELVKRGAFAELAAAVDTVMAQVRAHCTGRFQEQLMAHLTELPA
ncbi:MAG: hypothetical protein EBZ48_05670 [Proteobacteria bacterium]|nr:hypothetical protein [Pseudomonadota bacterium]